MECIILVLTHSKENLLNIRKTIDVNLRRVPHRTNSRGGHAGVESPIISLDGSDVQVRHHLSVSLHVLTNRSAEVDKI